jgi:hypothetical protein
VTLSWDPARFQFVSESAGGTPGWSTIANPSTGQVVISGFNAAAGATTNFTLHNITLKPLSAAAGATVNAVVSTAGNEAAATIVVPVRNLTATINP